VKKVLVVADIPRTNGNSDMTAKQVLKGESQENIESSLMQLI